MDKPREYGMAYEVKYLTLDKTIRGPLENKINAIYKFCIFFFLKAIYMNVEFYFFLIFIYIL